MSWFYKLKILRGRIYCDFLGINEAVDGNGENNEITSSRGGIGVIQIGVVAKDLELTQILTREFEVPIPVFIVMHEDLRSSRRIQLLFEFFAQKLTKFCKPW